MPHRIQRRPWPSWTVRKVRGTGDRRRANLRTGDRPIVTIEAIGQDPVGRAIQDAWVSHDVVQCGYCQSGQIMSAVALLKSNRKPTDKDIEQSMGGNICRCGTYVRIREAIKMAAETKP